ncbi:hypothetical protein F5B18DRAFT_602037, partial [Nemania serpens]
MRRRPYENLYAGVTSRSRSNPRDGRRRTQSRAGHLSAATNLNANGNWNVHFPSCLHSSLSPETANTHEGGTRNPNQGFSIQELFELMAARPVYMPSYSGMFCGVPFMGRRPRQQQRDPDKDTTGQKARSVSLSGLATNHGRSDDQLADDASTRGEAGVDEVLDTDALVEGMGNLKFSSTTSTAQSSAQLYDEAPLGPEAATAKWILETSSREQETGTSVYDAPWDPHWYSPVT